jgi:riboflavin synthase
VFTGLVRATGMVARVNGGKLLVEPQPPIDLSEGASVAVNGVCLTVVEIDSRGFEVDVMDETMRSSTLGDLSDGDRVNIELPMRLGDALDGHLVQGHVDGVGTVQSAREEGVSRVLRIQPPAELLRYVVHKGSIAVDGVSLTVSSVDDEAFEVSLIPETLERTTLGAAARGRTVNLEVDVLAKYVEKLSAR